MAQAKLTMLSCMLLALSGCGNLYRWDTVAIDGSRTGCVAATSENVSDALGQISPDGSYRSPSGKVYPSGSATAQVASVLIDAQPGMAQLKKVIAHSEEFMPNDLFENRLSNWYLGILMNKVSSLSGRKVDVGICNFGGIRAGMPEGDVMLDDIMTMFPFRNYLVYLELSGKQLRDIFDRMAAGRFQAVGGVNIVVEDKKVISAEIGGSPIDDDRLYSVATISFLLNGGDGLYLASGARNLMEYDVLIVDAVLEYVHALSAAGHSIKGSDVRYVTIR